MVLRQMLSRAAGEASESAELRRQLKQAVEEQLQAVEKAGCNGSGDPNLGSLKKNPA